MLDEDWHKVHLQTSWRLESCFAPLATDSGNTTSNPASTVECDANPSSLTATEVAGTMGNDVSTSPEFIEPTPATIVTTLTDASQPSTNHPNKNVGMSMTEESPINHSNCNNNATREDESSHA